MNANEMNNARLNRIKIVSRMAKYLCFVFLAGSIGFWLLFFSSSPVSGSASQEDVIRTMLVLGFQVLVWFWYWKLSRLFGFYERGLIFAEKTIRCIKTLGLVCMMGWTLTGALHYLPRHAPSPPATVSQETSTVKERTTVITQRLSYRIGFFTFDLGTGIDFGPLLAGSLILVIGWIMDEGRKIQEEQELTV